MKHLLISVDKIHPNPRRDFERNPLDKEQIDKIRESIGRTGFWNNVVVRKHPTIKGEYQLAYGHNRLEAVRLEGITEVTLPVADLSDWDMYLAMVDENNTQRVSTPAIAFENVLVGLEMIEAAFEAIGEDGTEEAFHRQQGGIRSVHRCTDRQKEKDHGFEIAKAFYFKNKKIGRQFLEQYLPDKKLHEGVINAVLKAHYAEKQQQKADADAAAKEQEAKEKEEQAKKEKEEKERKRLEKEAAEDREKAKQLREEAKKVADGCVAVNILMMFETTSQMVSFNNAVRDALVPAKQHKKLAEEMVRKDIGKRSMAKEVGDWWYEHSGQRVRDFNAKKAEQALKEFEKRIRHGDFHRYLLDLDEKILSLMSDVEIAVGPASFYERQEVRDSVREHCNQLRWQLEKLMVSLKGAAVPLPEEQTNGQATRRIGEKLHV